MDHVGWWKTCMIKDSKHVHEYVRLDSEWIVEEISMCGEVVQSSSVASAMFETFLEMFSIDSMKKIILSEWEKEHDREEDRTPPIRLLNRSIVNYLLSSSVCVVQEIPNRQRDFQAWISNIKHWFQSRSNVLKVIKANKFSMTPMCCKIGHTRNDLGKEQANKWFDQFL